MEDVTSHSAQVLSAGVASASVPPPPLESAPAGEESSPHRATVDTDERGPQEHLPIPPAVPTDQADASADPTDPPAQERATDDSRHAAGRVEAADAPPASSALPDVADAPSSIAETQAAAAAAASLHPPAAIEEPAPATAPPRPDGAAPATDAGAGGPPADEGVAPDLPAPSSIEPTDPAPPPPPSLDAESEARGGLATSAPLEAPALSPVTSNDIPSAAAHITPPAALAAAEKGLGTPPTPGVVNAGKKFASSLAVNKKFLDKLGPDAKAAVSAQAKSSLSPAAPLGANASGLVGAAQAAGPRLLTGKLSSAVPIGPSSGQWARGANVASGSFLAFQTSAAAKAGAAANAAPARGRGRGARPTAAGDVWGRSNAAGSEDFDTQLSRLGEFPTAAEAAKSKQLKANAIAAANAAKESASRVAAEAAEKAAREYNQHLLENLDAFRGLHLDPNASHWDEMADDDDIGDVVDFGDGAQYKLDDQLATPPSGPTLATTNEFDRGGAGGIDRRLFNDRLNKLETVPSKRDAAAAAAAAAAVPAQLLKKGKSQSPDLSAPAAVTPTTTTTTAASAASKTRSREASQTQQPAVRPKLPPPPTKNPWNKPEGEILPLDPSLPSLTEAASLPEKSVEVPVPTPVLSSDAPSEPPTSGPPQLKLGSKEFAESQEREMRDYAEKARKRRMDEEAAQEAQRKDAARLKLAELEARIAVKSPPVGTLSAPSDLALPPLTPPASTRPSVISPAEDVAQPMRRGTSGSKVDSDDSWRVRAPLPPVEPIKQSASRLQPETTLTEHTNRPHLSDKVQLLRKPPQQPAPAPSAPTATNKSSPTPPEMAPIAKGKGRRGSANVEPERFWRKSVAELATKPEDAGKSKRSRHASADPTLPESASVQPAANAKTKKRAAAAAAKSSTLAETAPTVVVAPIDNNASLNDTMARIKEAMAANKQAALTPQEEALVGLLAENSIDRQSAKSLDVANSGSSSPRAYVRPTSEALTTSAIFEFPPTSVWKTYTVRLARIAKASDQVDDRILADFWSRPSRDRLLDLVTWQLPHNNSYGHGQVERDRNLFREPFVTKGKAKRPPRVRFVPMSAASDHFASRARLVDDIMPVTSSVAALALVEDSLSDARPTSLARPVGRADSERIWRRAVDQATTIPDLSDAIESLLFDEVGLGRQPALITLQLPSSPRGPQSQRRVRLPMSSGSSILQRDSSSDADLVGPGVPQVRLPGKRSATLSRQVNPAATPIPSASTVQRVMLDDEMGAVPPLQAALASSDEESLDASRVTPLPTVLLPAAPVAKAKIRLGGMSESVHAVPFAPSTPSQDATPKTRATLSTPATTTWSPAGAASSPFSIIDPQLKNVWGPSDHLEPSTTTQENSLMGIVDDLPSTTVPPINDLKADDASPVADTHAEPPTSHADAVHFDTAPEAGANREMLFNRASAAEALASVGGLPYGRQYLHDDMGGMQYMATSPPPPHSTTYYAQPYYSQAVPASTMAYSVVSPNMMPMVVNNGSPWMHQGQTAGMASPYPPSARAAYGSGLPDGYQTYAMNGPFGQPYASAAPAHGAYKGVNARGNGRPPIGSGRPIGGSNYHRSPSMPISPGPPSPYEPFASPTFPTAALPGARSPPVAHGHAGTHYTRAPSYSFASFAQQPTGGRWA